MTGLKRKCCVVAWANVFLMTSFPAKAEDLYVVRFPNGEQVVFELTSHRVRLVTDAEGKELGKILPQTTQAVEAHVETPFTGIGNARWVELKDRMAAFLKEERPGTGYGFGTSGRGSGRKPWRFGMEMLDNDRASSTVSSAIMPFR